MMTQSTYVSAMMATRDLLMLLPLEAFCLIPIWHRKKHKGIRLFLSLLFANLLAFLLIFLSFLIADRAGEFLAFFSVLISFFCFFRREIDLPFIRLAYLLSSALPVGGFGNIVYHLTDAFLNPTGTIYDSGNWESVLAQMTFETIMLLLLLPVLRGPLRKVLFEFREDRPFLPALIIHLLYAIVCRIAVPIYNERLFIGRSLEIYLLVFSTSFALVFVLFYLFLRVMSSIIENEDLMEKAALVDLQAEQYRRLEEYLQETSRLRHDFRYQMGVLTELLKDGKVPEALELLNSLDSLSYEENYRYTFSRAVNALLNHFHTRLLQAGAKAEFHIRLEEPLFVEEIDLCVVLGNLMENALEAVMRVPEERRSVSLLMGQTTAEVLVMKVENPYVEPVKKEGKSFLSTRHLGLGEGLRSVSLLAEKYGGSMRVDYLNGVFLVKVLFQKRPDLG